MALTHRALALDPAGAVARHERLDLSEAHKVHVAGDGLVQAGGRGLEIVGFLEAMALEQSVDDADREGVATSDSVDNMVNQVPP